LKAGETFKAGDIVALDANEDVAEVTSADQTPILGFAAENAADVVESGYVTVWVADEGTVFAMQGDNAPVKADINQSYGYIEDGDGVYTVDGTDTTNVVLYVDGIDTNRELYFCKVLVADRQYAG